MIALAVFVAVLCLAYANGANDNFKGVASLYAGGSIGYRGAIGLGTGATLAGSFTSVLLAQGLIATFSGKGIVPPEVVGGEAFLLSTAIGAASTVLLATRTGFPVSTTHALVGGIIGAGAVSAGANLSVSGIAAAFVLPLVVSPLLSLGSAAAMYWTIRLLRPGTQRGSGAGAPNPRGMELLGTYVDRLHVMSAGVVSFARGLNDTPKVAALMVSADMAGVPVSLGLVGGGIALGGLFSARRVALTLGERITRLDPLQGLCANLTTAVLVVCASRLGLPVSTTHVSVGALFGIGLTTDQADTRVVKHVILSWVLTVPCAIVIGALVRFVLPS